MKEFSIPLYNTYIYVYLCITITIFEPIYEIVYFEKWTLSI